MFSPYLHHVVMTTTAEEHLRRAEDRRLGREPRRPKGAGRRASLRRRRAWRLWPVPAALRARA